MAAPRVVRAREDRRPWRLQGMFERSDLRMLFTVGSLVKARTSRSTSMRIGFALPVVAGRTRIQELCTSFDNERATLNAFLPDQASWAPLSDSRCAPQGVQTACRDGCGVSIAKVFARFWELPAYFPQRDARRGHGGSSWC